MKHNKKRNTAFLYETLILEMTRCVIEQDEEQKHQVMAILKEHFGAGSILREELEAYRSIYETKGVTEKTAEKILLESQRVFFGLHPHHVFNQQTQVIKKVNKNLKKDVFNSFLPNYKSLATISQIFSTKTSPRRRIMLEQSMVNEMTSEQPETRMEPVDNIVLNLFIEKFNDKYSESLLPEQKDILFKYILSFVDNGVGLKVALNEEVGRLRKVISDNKNSHSSLGDRMEDLSALLESFGKRDIDDSVVLKVLQVQEFCKELV